jgi:transposase
MSALDLTLEPEPVGIRRLEVITGVGGRRTWSREMKARIVAETLEPNPSVSAIARRHDLRPQRIFTWRRRARANSARSAAPEAPAFTPVIIDPPAIRQSAATCQEPSSAAPPADLAPIEVEIGGAVVRVRRNADARTLAAVIRVLKSSR